MLTSRPGGSTQRTYSARLGCGTALTYEAPTFVPAVGELVPCRRHGFCPVTSRDPGDGRGAGLGPRMMRSTSQEDLLAFLNSRPVTTVHGLRRHRFTLRMLWTAQGSGLIDVDLVAGRVTLRACPGPACGACPSTQP